MRGVVLVLVVALLAVTAGCHEGGGGTATPAGEDVEAATESPTAAATTDGEGTATASESATPTPGATTVTVVDGTYLSMTYRGSDPIPGTAFASIMQDGGGPAGQVGTEIAPGETVYVYIMPGDTYEVAVSEDPPEEARAIQPGTYSLEITVEDQFEPVVSVEFTVEG